MNKIEATPSMASMNMLPPVQVTVASDMKTGIISSTNAIAQSAFKVLDEAWKYINNLIRLTRLGTHGAADWCNRFANTCLFRTERMKIVDRQLGLFKAINIPRNIADIPKILRKVRDSSRLSDGEGIAMAGLGLMLTLCDTLDELFSVINTSLQVTGHAAIDILDTISIPLAYLLVTASIGSRSAKAHRSRKLYKELQEELLNKYVENPPSDAEEFCQTISAYLQKRLGVTEEEMREVLSQLPEVGIEVSSEEVAEQKKKLLSDLKEKKHAMVKRQADDKVVDAMNMLMVALEVKETLDLEQVEKVLDAVKDMHKATTRRTAIHVVEIIAKVLTFVGITLAALSVPALAVVVVLVLALLLKLGRMVYKEQFQYKDIDLSLEFLDDIIVNDGQAVLIGANR